MRLTADEMRGRVARAARVQSASMADADINLTVSHLSAWSDDHLRRAHRLMGLSVLRMESAGEYGVALDRRRREAEAVGSEVLRRG